jgi:uncharacterized membrane protein
VEIAAVRFYDVIVFVHVAAVVAAFGPTFAYPILQAVAERGSPRNLPFMWRTLTRIDLALLTPGAIVILLAGIYLVVSSDGPWDWGDTFVGVGIAAIVVLLGLVHAVLRPTERKLADLAERDIEASGPTVISLSDEYWVASRRWGLLGSVASLVILIALFFMVVKP